MNVGRRERQRRRAAKLVGRAHPFLGLDLFGLQREHRISETHARHVFTPHQPISTKDLLFGRQQEVQALVQTLNTPGQHVLLYGERGVGKSSLANVVGHIVNVAMGRRIFVKRCDAMDSFETIVKGPLAAVGADLSLVEVSDTTSIAAKSGLASTGLSLARERARDIMSTYRALGEVSPSSVAEAICGVEGFLVIDEADAIVNLSDRKKLAELIKQLSDSGSAFKIMVVGIAGTGNELTAEHPSIERCLRDTKLGRMADAELVEIIQSGAKALKIDFAPAVVGSIVGLSEGYPHFTHLISLKCVEEAIGKGRKRVDEGHLAIALNEAVKDAEGALRKSYSDSVRSTSEMYKSIVMAAASLRMAEFGTAQWREAVSRETGREVPSGFLKNYSQKLISVDGSTIIRRTAPGYYRFEDPRMASFVRIANQML
ncbi:nSTAND1 domain-containing NTPase [Amycolatopsis magusensis]|uniref:nSTAND1 domain-containing NTPase n=1 Tax=Amycolatopsis magusensis TaxID=882444 RepID=UPI0024A80D4B|nr:ATP-binding protein [Amycolatopsis magusensis]MDI5979611.1 ATP-binding protein [Amycolatopsis magusensis]